MTLTTIKKNCSVATPRILDAGCGTGGMLFQLKKNGYTNLSGFDLSGDAVKYALQRSEVPVILLDMLQVDKAYQENSFDIIISHDTLCLLEDNNDKKALKKLMTVLKPGGLLLMNLPALKAFNGMHDIAVGIRRRYTKADVEKLAAGTASIKKITYWPFFMSLPVFVARCVQRARLRLDRDASIESDVKMPPSFLNTLFYTVTSFENNMLQAKPWGSSLFVVMQKSAADKV